MGTVFTMRFNKDQAAIVADESTWHLGVFYDYRRTNFADSILPLINTENEDGTKCAAIYAGLGFPSFHSEVAEISKNKISSLLSSGELSNENIQKNIFSSFDSVHKRYVNDRMNFHYGFNLNDLNTGKFSSQNESYDLSQTSIKNEARKISGYGDKREAMNRIFDNSGFVLNYDSENGIEGLVLSPGYRGIAYSSILNVLGHGSRVSNKVLNSTIVEKKNLPARRDGFSMEEGLFHLMHISSCTYEMTNKMGGYFQIYLVDMTKKNKEDRIVEICDHRSRLVHEIMKGHIYEFLSEKKATELTHSLLTGERSFEEVEEDMFKSVNNLERFKLRLHDYKIFPELSADENFEAGETK